MDQWMRIIAAIAVVALGGCSTLSDVDRSSEGADKEDVAEKLRIVDDGYVSPAEDRDLMYQLLVAEFAGARGQLSTALEAYLKAMHLTDDPRIAARATRISVYNDAHGAGVEAARRWVALDDQDTSARQALGVFLLRNGETQEALEVFQDLVRRADDPGAALGQVAASLSSEEDNTSAIAVLESLATTFADVPEAHLVHAQFALRTGDARAALAAAEAGLAVAPESRDLAALRAQALIEAGREAEGVDAFEDLIARNPADGELRLFLARTLLDVGREEEALAHFRQVLRERPNDAEVLYATGVLTLEAGHPEAAEPYFLRLLELGERSSQAHFLLGQIAEEQGNAEDALHWYEQVDGNNQVSATMRRAMLLGDLGRIEAARDLLGQVRIDRPEEALRAYLVEGEVLRRNRQYEAAMAVYNEALGRHPGDTDLIYGRALVAVQQGDVTTAERDLRYLLDREPDNAHALNALGYTLVDATDRQEEGFELIRRAYAMEPDNAAIIDSMGWAHYRMGELQEAEDYLQRAYELMPDAEVAAHLGEVLWAMGHRDEARRVWRDALERSPDDPVLIETMQRLDAS